MAVTTSPSTATESNAAPWETPSGSSLTWLLVGAVCLAAGALLLLLAAVQTVAPGVLTIGASTTVGRVRPAAFILLVYGGLGMVGSGVALDVARRLAKAPVQLERLARGAGALTTLGVVLSALAVLAGHGNGRTGFEMPRGLAVVIAVGQLLVLCSVLRTVAKRVTDEVHPALWFIVAGLVAAPFVIAAGALPRVHGVNDELVLAFGLSGLKLLWLIPVGIGTALYVVPAASRAPLHSRRLAVIAFWGWFLAAPFAGPVRLLGGPAQDWVETVGVAASIALAVPVLAVVVLLCSTYARRTSLAHDIDLRFALAGAGLIALWGLLAAATSGRTAGDLLHATVFADGLAELALHGVAGAFLLAGLFHALPIVSGNQLANPRVAGAAVWLLAGGATLVALSLLVAGYVEGSLWAQGVRDGLPNTGARDFLPVFDAMRPLLWLRAIGEGLVLLAFGAAFQQVFSTSASGEPIDEVPNAPAGLPARG
ncbi:MAG TPA: cbb3-type cytochrome c oxidase subunit I [Mycobacteriales bacterium]|nr:cbb3-type cytochrome c oxidase subunit I [Mycobacteriales bacterium]